MDNDATWTLEPEPTWSAIAKKAVLSLVEQGPTIVVLLLILGVIGFVLWKWVGPWTRDYLLAVHATVQTSIEQRGEEREADLEQKRELIEHHERIEKGHEEAIGGLDERVGDLETTTRELVEKVDPIGEQVGEIYQKFVKES